jgi:hypothetical protein
MQASQVHSQRAEKMTTKNTEADTMARTVMCRENIPNMILDFG